MSIIPHIRRSPAAMQRLYNLIHRFYGGVERMLGPKLDGIVRQKIATIPGVSSASALEYACGSGLLTLKLAGIFSVVTARDQSAGMLDRARRRANGKLSNSTFTEGNLLSPNEPAGSFDYVFVSFALHLFPWVEQVQILKNLFAISRKGVIIIDHERTWRPGIAFAEWLEGGYYDAFIKTDFAPVARQIGCTRFAEDTVEECMVLSFFK